MSNSSTAVPSLIQSNIDEFFTSEQCFITELSNSTKDPGLSIAKARVEPGVSTRWHYVKATLERYHILSGCGVVEVGNTLKQSVAAGDTVIIPADMPQRITNTGQEDLIFLALCSPRFEPKNYVEL